MCLIDEAFSGLENRNYEFELYNFMQDSDLSSHAHLFLSDSCTKHVPSVCSHLNAKHTSALKCTELPMHITI